MASGVSFSAASVSANSRQINRQAMEAFGTLDAWKCCNVYMEMGLSLQRSSVEKREKRAYSAADDVGANARERDVDNHVRLACEQA